MIINIISSECQMHLNRGKIATVRKDSKVPNSCIITRSLWVKFVFQIGHIVEDYKEILSIKNMLVYTDFENFAHLLLFKPCVFIMPFVLVGRAVKAEVPGDLVNISYKAENPEGW